MIKIKTVSNAVPAHMPGLQTWRALPRLRMDELDPYLFLNHHGPENFQANNDGLPFGPHPHRGFETLTFIVEGELVHKDSQGFSSRITKGGIQWMTAGAGIIHSETSSEEFLKEGGPLEILQLWINLPAAKKSSPAHYQGFHFEDIPHIEIAPGVILDLIAGQWADYEGPVSSPYPQFMSTIRMVKGAKVDLDLKGGQVLFYLVSGSLKVLDYEVQKRQLLQFEATKGRLHVEALSNSYLIFGEADPINEPIAAQGPFVMSSQEELYQAFVDYQAGKMGEWKD